MTTVSTPPLMIRTLRTEVSKSRPLIKCKSSELPTLPLPKERCKELSINHFWSAIQTNNTSNLLGVNSYVRQSGEFKTSVYAYGQHEVLVRVQNMQDNFDGKGLNMKFDVDEFAQKFYREAMYK